MVRFSIVINNYNYEQYVGQAIESVLQQSYKDLELIVVDDGSTDRSRSIIEQYPEVNALFQDNKGQCSAFRTGLSVATGEILIQLDSDDLLTPDACSKLDAIWEPDVTYAQFQLMAFSEKSGDIGRIPRKPFVRDHVRHLIEKGRFPYSPTTGNAYSTSVAKAIMATVDPPDRFSPDGLLITCGPLAGRTVIIPEPLGRYRIHDKNFSWGVSLEKSFKTATVIREGAFKYAQAIGRPLPADALISQRSAFATSLKLFAQGCPLVDIERCQQDARFAWLAGLRDKSAPLSDRLKLMLSGGAFYTAPRMAARLSRKMVKWRNTPTDNIGKI